MASLRASREFSCGAEPGACLSNLAICAISVFRAFERDIGFPFAESSSRTEKMKCAASVSSLDNFSNSPEPIMPTFLESISGPASITIDIAKRYPSATILGIDGSPVVISQARDAAQKANVHNIRFAVGDALDLTPTASEPGFELLKGSCDVAHTHNVVMHTTDGPRTLVELRSAIKVGGLVCCKEADRACLMMWPESKAIRRTYDVISAIMEAKGCDPYVGRKLKTYAMAAVQGFSGNDIRVGQAPWVVNSRDEREKWGGLVARTSADPEARTRIEQDARCIGHEINLEELYKGWRDWIEDDTACASISDIYVVCKKQ